MTASIFGRCITGGYGPWTQLKYVEVVDKQLTDKNTYSSNSVRYEDVRTKPLYSLPHRPLTHSHPVHIALIHATSSVGRRHCSGHKHNAQPRSEQPRQQGFSVQLNWHDTHAQAQKLKLKQNPVLPLLLSSIYLHPSSPTILANIPHSVTVT